MSKHSQTITESSTQLGHCADCRRPFHNPSELMHYQGKRICRDAKGCAHRAFEHWAVEMTRCDQEIAAMYAQEPTQPAVITTLGIEDWQGEKRILQRMAATSATGGAR